MPSSSEFYQRFCSSQPGATQDPVPDSPSASGPAVARAPLGDREVRAGCRWKQLSSGAKLRAQPQAPTWVQTPCISWTSESTQKALSAGPEVEGGKPGVTTNPRTKGHASLRATQQLALGTRGNADRRRGTTDHSAPPVLCPAGCSLERPTGEPPGGESRSHKPRTLMTVEIQSSPGARQLPNDQPWYTRTGDTACGWPPGMPT